LGVEEKGVGLQGIHLSGFFTLVKDLLHASFSVGAGDIFFVDHISHQVFEMRLGVFN
jgi:hypothetical protein